MTEQVKQDLVSIAAHVAETTATWKLRPQSEMPGLLARFGDLELYALVDQTIQGRTITTRVVAENLTFHDGHTILALIRGF